MTDRIDELFARLYTEAIYSSSASATKRDMNDDLECIEAALAEAIAERDALQADNQRLTERNTALEAGLWMMCEEAAGHYLHSQGYAMPKCSETGGCSEPEDFDCQHHCSKARRANAWYRAAMLHAVALCAGSIRNGKARSHRW